jgi:enolase
MTKIKQVRALEILDSRGRPTVKAWCELDSGIVGAASVPSGASTGQAEAHELRDTGEARFLGLGVRQAVAHVNGEINVALRSQTIDHQAALDQRLLDLDGSSQKQRLGANAILAVSLAFARARAKQSGETLYSYFSSLNQTERKALPRPTINLFSGGKHAGGQVPIQDLLIVPAQDNLMDCYDATFRIYQAAAALGLQKYKMRALSADEGGLAPPFPDLKSMLDDALQSIETAGFTPGKDIFLAMDVAASHFFQAGQYDLGEKVLSSEQMIAELRKWTRQYPIVSLEDGLAEEEWQHWPGLTSALDASVLVLGDDFLCTNPDRIRRAIARKAANALLLKVNQIGTLSEAAQAYQLAKEAGWQVTVSARSGETEDNWLADLSVGWQGDQIKIGSITQSERLAKYNRLLEIEKETGLPMVDWPN